VSQGKASCQLVGNLVRDCETRTTGTGMAVVRFTVAVTTKGKDREDTAFIDCTCFDKRGEAFAKYHRKGARVIVDGRIQQENWDDKATGQKRSKLSVIVNDWHFAGGDQQAASPSRPSAQASPAVGGSMGEADDTPF